LLLCSDAKAKLDAFVAASNNADSAAHGVRRCNKRWNDAVRALGGPVKQSASTDKDAPKQGGQSGLIFSPIDFAEAAPSSAQAASASAGLAASTNAVTALKGIIKMVLLGADEASHLVGAQSADAAAMFVFFNLADWTSRKASALNTMWREKNAPLYAMTASMLAVLQSTDANAIPAKWTALKAAWKTASVDSAGGLIANPCALTGNKVTSPSNAKAVEASAALGLLITGLTNMQSIWNDANALSQFLYGKVPAGQTASAAATAVASAAASTAKDLIKKNFEAIPVQAVDPTGNTKPVFDGFENEAAKLTALASVKLVLAEVAASVATQVNGLSRHSETPDLEVESPQIKALQDSITALLNTRKGVFGMWNVMKGPEWLVVRAHAISAVQIVAADASTKKEGSKPFQAEARVEFGLGTKTKFFDLDLLKVAWNPIINGKDIPELMPTVTVAGVELSTLLESPWAFVKPMFTQLTFYLMNYFPFAQVVTKSIYNKFFETIFQDDKVNGFYRSFSSTVDPTDVAAAAAGAPKTAFKPIPRSTPSFLVFAHDLGQLVEAAVVAQTAADKDNKKVLSADVRAALDTLLAKLDGVESEFDTMNDGVDGSFGLRVGALKAKVWTALTPFFAGANLVLLKKALGYTFSLAKEVNVLLRSRRLLLEAEDNKKKVFYRQMTKVSEKLAAFKKPINELTAALKTALANPASATSDEKAKIVKLLKRVDTFAKYAKAIHAPGFLAQRGLAKCLFTGLRGRLDKVYASLRDAVDASASFAFEAVLPKDEPEETPEAEEDDAAVSTEEQAASDAVTQGDKTDEDGESPPDIFEFITSAKEGEDPDDASADEASDAEESEGGAKESKSGWMPECGEQFALLQFFYHANTPAMTKESMMSSMGLNALRVIILTTPKILEFMVTLAAFSAGVTEAGASAKEAGFDIMPALTLDPATDLAVMANYFLDKVKDKASLTKSQAFYTAISEALETGKKLVAQFLEIVDLVFGPESPALAAFRWLIEKIRTLGETLARGVKKMVDRMAKFVTVAAKTTAAVVTPYVRNAAGAVKTGTDPAIAVAVAAAERIAARFNEAAAVISTEAGDLQRYIMERTVVFGLQVSEYQEQLISSVKAEVRQLKDSSVVVGVADATSVVAKWMNAAAISALAEIKTEAAAAKDAFNAAVQTAGLIVDDAIDVASEVASRAAVQGAVAGTVVVNGVNVVVGAAESLREDALQRIEAFSRAPGSKKFLRKVRRIVKKTRRTATKGIKLLKAAVSKLSADVQSAYVNYARPAFSYVSAKAVAGAKRVYEISTQGLKVGEKITKDTVKAVIAAANAVIASTGEIDIGPQNLACYNNLVLEEGSYATMEHFSKALTFLSFPLNFMAGPVPMVLLIELTGKMALNSEVGNCIEPTAKAVTKEQAEKNVAGTETNDAAYCAATNPDDDEPRCNPKNELTKTAGKDVSMWVPDLSISLGASAFLGIGFSLSPVPLSAAAGVELKLELITMHIPVTFAVKLQNAVETDTSVTALAGAIFVKPYLTSMAGELNIKAIITLGAWSLAPTFHLMKWGPLLSTPVPGLSKCWDSEGGEGTTASPYGPHSIKVCPEKGDPDVVAPPPMEAEPSTTCTICNYWSKKWVCPMTRDRQNSVIGLGWDMPIQLAYDQVVSNVDYFNGRRRSIEVLAICLEKVDTSKSCNPDPWTTNKGVPDYTSSSSGICGYGDKGATQRDPARAVYEGTMVIKYLSKPTASPQPPVLFHTFTSQRTVDANGNVWGGRRGNWYSALKAQGQLEKEGDAKLKKAWNDVYSEYKVLHPENPLTTENRQWGTEAEFTLHDASTKYKLIERFEADSNYLEDVYVPRPMHYIKHSPSNKDWVVRTMPEAERQATGLLAVEDRFPLPASLPASLRSSRLWTTQCVRCTLLFSARDFVCARFGRTAAINSEVKVGSNGAADALIARVLVAKAVIRNYQSPSGAAETIADALPADSFLQAYVCNEQVRKTGNKMDYMGYVFVRSAKWSDARASYVSADADPITRAFRFKYTNLNEASIQAIVTKSVKSQQGVMNRFFSGLSSFAQYMSESSADREKREQLAVSDVEVARVFKDARRPARVAAFNLYLKYIRQIDAEVTLRKPCKRNNVLSEAESLAWTKSFASSATSSDKGTGICAAVDDVSNGDPRSSITSLLRLNTLFSKIMGEDATTSQNVFSDSFGNMMALDKNDPDKTKKNLLKLINDLITKAYDTKQVASANAFGLWTGVTDGYVNRKFSRDYPVRSGQVTGSKGIFVLGVCNEVVVGTNYFATVCFTASNAHSKCFRLKLNLDGLKSVSYTPSGMIYSDNWDAVVTALAVEITEETHSAARKFWDLSFDEIVADRLGNEAHVFKGLPTCGPANKDVKAAVAKI